MKIVFNIQLLIIIYLEMNDWINCKQNIVKCLIIIKTYYYNNIMLRKQLNKEINSFMLLLLAIIITDN